MIDVQGTVAPGFEPVAAQLHKLISDGEERGAAVAVYFEGRPVVDIWAGQADDSLWTEDTLAVTFSTTKGVSALCMQMLHDRGVIDVDAPITKYWPEYGAAGKESTLVKHVLNHTSGQHTYPNYWDEIAPDYEGLSDQEMIAGRLAESPPAWEPGSKMMYHALTYGNLVGELVKRVDGRTIGQFFRDELAAPLDLDFWIGLPDELTDRVALPRGDDPLHGRRLTFRRRCIEAGRDKILRGDVFHRMAWPFAVLLAHPDIDDPLELSKHAHDPWFPGVELAASNGIGTARALAKLYAVLAEGGSLDGHHVVSPESIRRFSDPAEGKGGFALGYSIPPKLLMSLGLGAGTFGSGGVGGTMALADPTNRISMAVTKNQMRDMSAAAPRIILAVYGCLRDRDRATKLRQTAARGLFNNRRVASTVFGGAQWLHSFSKIENANPLDKE